MFQKLDQQPTQQKEAALESEWFSNERIWKHACSLLALGGRLVLLSLAQNYSVSGHHNLTCSRQSFFLARCMSIYCKKNTHDKPSKPYTIHQPFEVSERAWREVFFKTNINKHGIRLISDPILKSLDSHSSHTQHKFSPKVPRGQWVSELNPAQICRCRQFGERTQLGDFLLKGPVKRQVFVGPCHQVEIIFTTSPPPIFMFFVVKSMSLFFQIRTKNILMENLQASTR